MIRNKRTGEIVKSYIIETAEAIGAKLILQDNDTNNHYEYNSLAELYEEWEDVPEEPKEYWYIADNGVILNHTDGGGSWNGEFRNEIGNRFETKEEAEEIREKLKAWKRLKDNGYKFNGIGVEYDGYKIYLKCDIMKKEHYTPTQDHKDLDLLFGGEE